MPCAGSGLTTGAAAVFSLIESVLVVSDVTIPADQASCYLGYITNDRQSFPSTQVVMLSDGGAVSGNVHH